MNGHCCWERCELVFIIDICSIQNQFDSDHFELGTNLIGDNGAQALSEALKINSTLTTLNLRSNFIGDDGAQALAEALKTNSTLSVLDLSDNSIGNYGVQALSEALKTNSTIAVEYYNAATRQ
ncbi:hypothetical protein MVEG_01643 [Podila verticillata NRRL 6337]|nr:hypothetical protein MVEG_01643 [Podila verticillata NRRL 6337]